MGAPVIHFEIMGGEGTQLETFYRELFGWKINSNNPMKYVLSRQKGDRKASMVALVPRTTGANAFPYTHRSRICRQLLTGRSTLELRQSFRRPKYREVLG